jgi:Phosphopantothenoylcysteine synthetase/decarboxylase
MSSTNRYENLPSKHYQEASEFGVESEDEMPSYSDLEDLSLELAGEDEFLVEDEGFGGAEVLGYVPQDPAGIRQWLGELRDGGKITQAEYQCYLAQVNRATGLSGQRREQALVKLTGEITAKFAEQVPEDNAFPGDGGASEDLPAQAEGVRKTIASMANLRESDKQKFLERIDQAMHRLDLSKDSPDGGESVRDEVSIALEEIQIEATELGAYPTGVAALADALSMDPAELKVPKGMNLEKPPNPPTPDFLKKLAELSPELQAAFEQVEAAVNDRVKFYELNLHDAKAINDANDNSTTDSDATDMGPWQNLFNLRHFQDEKSKTVKDAMQAAVKALIPVLQSLYPELEVKAVEANSETGWKKTEAEFKAADKITIGGNTIDLFNNQDGSLQSGGVFESDIKIDIPAVKYDNEGNGQWSVPSFETYGDKQPGHSNYDDDAGGSDFDDIL